MGASLISCRFFLIIMVAINYHLNIFFNKKQSLLLRKEITI